MVQTCFKGQNRYGNDASELKDRIKLFNSSEKLSRYDLERITEAFRRWVDDNEQIPTVAGILDILTGRNKPARYVQPQFPKQEYNPPPTEAEKQTVSEIVAAAKDNLSADKPKQDIGKQDYKHFESTPEKLRPRLQTLIAKS